MNVNDIGVWSIYATKLDDIAYELYLENHIKYPQVYVFETQEFLIKMNKIDKKNFSTYYKKANILLRNKKIKNIIKKNI